MAQDAEAGRRWQERQCSSLAKDSEHDDTVSHYRPGKDRAMKKLLVMLLLGAAFWQFYLSKPGSPVISNIANDGSVMGNPVVTQPGSAFSLDSLRPSSSISQPAAQVAGNPYRCDGRTHCSQMTSCAEAIFFLRNCPGTRMDGDNDGVPCEGQWCGR